jgi:altronate dehydratase large subunit
VPLIKITGNTNTYQRMIEDMDFNAGRVLTGECSLAAAADELLALVTQIAAGQSAKPELLGHREYFIMYKHQDTPSLTAGCHA